MGRFAAPRPFLSRLRRATRFRHVAPLATAAVSLAVGPVAHAQGPIPSGDEFQVNTYTTGNQGGFVVDMNAAGDFVVAWVSSQEGSDSDYDVYARRYSAEGNPLGEVFRVNTTTTGRQVNVDIATDAAGAFVVVWQGYSPESESWDIYAQRYASSGAPVGEEFRVHGNALYHQESPAVEMNGSGDFVVVWQGRNGIFDSDIYTRVFSADGAVSRVERRINTYTTNDQRYPAVAIGEDGGFVVVWESYGPDDVGNGIYAQRCSRAGGLVGEAFHVNTHTGSHQIFADVAMNATGAFVVAWSSLAQDGYGLGVYAQAYDEAGAPRGGEFQVNSVTDSHQQQPSVAIDDEGDFVIGWEDYLLGARAQAFGADGHRRGGEFAVSTYTGPVQSGPSIAMRGEGDFVAVWVDYGRDGDGYGVFGVRYDEGAPATNAETAPTEGLALTVAPSPVGGEGRIRYEVPEVGPVRLVLYDAMGREVAVLADGAVAAGAHEATLDTAGLAPGVYVLRLAAGADVLIRRLTVAR